MRRSLKFLVALALVVVAASLATVTALAWHVTDVKATCVTEGVHVGEYYITVTWTYGAAHRYGYAYVGPGFAYTVSDGHHEDAPYSGHAPVALCIQPAPSPSPVPSPTTTPLPSPTPTQTPVATPTPTGTPPPPPATVPAATAAPKTFTCAAPYIHFEAKTEGHGPGTSPCFVMAANGTGVGGRG